MTLKNTVVVGLRGLGVLALACAYVLLTALFAMVEPVLRVVLLPASFLMFWVTILFGFVLDAPHFPAWGMLLFSVSLFLVYVAVAGLGYLLVGFQRD
ncbi:hypothetical protein O4G98_20125 [Zoogloeaceae bacterium G21618-S1]|nr:hypothetical protein [Zoogloeaceae bacterium G21618-S1]